MLAGTIGVENVRETQVNEEGNKCESEEREDAALGPGASAGEPGSTLEGSDQEVAFADETAIGSAEEKSFRPIPEGVKADGEPEITGAANREAEEKTNGGNLQEANGCLTGIEKMRKGKAERHASGGAPESSAAGKEEEQIAAEAELFADGDEEEAQGPGARVSVERLSSKRHGLNLEMSSGAKNEKNRGEHGEPPNGPFPEAHTENTLRRNTVIGERPPLTACGEPGSERDEKGGDAFELQLALDGPGNVAAAHAVRLQGVQERKRKNKGDDEKEDKCFALGAVPYRSRWRIGGRFRSWARYLERFGGHVWYG